MGMSATQTRAASQTGTLSNIVYVARKVEADLLRHHRHLRLQGRRESWATNVMRDVRILMDEEVIEKV